MKDETIILASGSPRRIAMMEAHGIHPLILKPTCRETLPAGIGMEDAVMLLSLRKALSVESSAAARNALLSSNASSANAPYLIAADTVVWQKELGILGKPKNRKDALRILRGLRGKSHMVATGVTILQLGTPKRRTFVETTKVFFTDYSDDALAAYVDTDEPYDKAGGYAIQGTFSKYIDHIEGDLDNVIGFPWTRIAAEFASLQQRCC